MLADIGGTNARFALYCEGHLGKSERLPVAEFTTASAALSHFVGAKGVAVRGAILAAAGPVEAGRVALTNSPWVIDGPVLASELGAPVRVVNDFAAVAWSLPALTAGDLVEIGTATAEPGAPAAALGPGTGLGLAHFVPDAGGLVIATEGGHATMAADNSREEAVIALLRGRFGHVSAERVLSGAGLVNLYEAIAELDGAAAAPRTPEEVTAAALAGRCEVCRAALDMFCGMLGGFAGNVALMAGARGGVYIAGGIVPGLTGHLAKSDFRQRFEAKGRYRRYLAGVATRVIVHPDPAFVGLRSLAERLFDPDGR